jgi:hypothetical protein
MIKSGIDFDPNDQEKGYYNVGTKVSPLLKAITEQVAI